MFFKASYETREKAHKIGQAFFYFVRSKLEQVGPQFAQNVQLYGYLHGIRVDGLRRFSKSEKDSEKAFKEMLSGFGGKFSVNYHTTVEKFEVAQSYSPDDRSDMGEMSSLFHGFMAGFVAAQIDMDKYESSGWAEYFVDTLAGQLED